MQEHETFDTNSQNKQREHHFVESVIKQCKTNKGLSARLRRADNPATEYQSWEFLGWFGIDLEKDYERLPFLSIAAAIAKSKAELNGSLPLGKAILACYENDSHSEQAKARLRRLLACNNLAEVCRILRSTLALIHSKVNQPLDYARLLRQLRSFKYESGYRTKVQWAQEFYGYSKTQPKNGETP